MNRSAQLMLLAVLLLDRPQQAPRLVEIAVVRPAVERGEALLAAVGAAAAVGGAIGARRVPGHADEERAVVAIIGRPPRLAVGHQRGQVALQRLIIERLERLGIIEVVAHRIGRAAALVEDVERQRLPATSRGWCGRAASAPRAFIGHPAVPLVFASMMSPSSIVVGRSLGRAVTATETIKLGQSEREIRLVHPCAGCRSADNRSR